jgi:hypothetical protein
VLLFACVFLASLRVAGADPERRPDAPVTGHETTAEHPEVDDDACAGTSASVPVEEAIVRARRAAGVDLDLPRGMARRARLAALLPTLGVRAARTTSWHDDEPEVGHATTYEARVTWRLERLIYDPRETTAARLAMAMRRERRHLDAHVIGLYYRWRHTCELVAAAELDALTDGWFRAARR